MVWKAKFENINQLTNRKHQFPLSHIHNHANIIGSVRFLYIFGKCIQIDQKAQDQIKMYYTF